MDEKWEDNVGAEKKGEQRNNCGRVKHGKMSGSGVRKGEGKHRGKDGRFLRRDSEDGVRKGEREVIGDEGRPESYGDCRWAE